MNWLPRRRGARTGTIVRFPHGATAVNPRPPSLPPVGFFFAFFFSLSFLVGFNLRGATRSTLETLEEIRRRLNCEQVATRGTTR